jgi:hypothetical protein
VVAGLRLRGGIVIDIPGDCDLLSTLGCARWPNTCAAGPATTTASCALRTTPSSRRAARVEAAYPCGPPHTGDRGSGWVPDRSG